MEDYFEDNGVHICDATGVTMARNPSKIIVEKKQTAYTYHFSRMKTGYDNVVLC